MKILILGGNSFVGKYYLKFSKISNLLATSRVKRKGFIFFDINKHNIEEIIDSHKISHVLFLSAISNPKECEKNKKKSNLINVKNTKKIINKILKKNIYFIFFSSEYIYDGVKGNYSENSKKKPKLLYGFQKLNIENFLNKKNKKNFSVLRLAKTYGDEIDDSSIFTSFLKNNFKIKKNYSFSFDQKFSALFVKDLVKIIDIFFKKKIKGFYNICGDEKYSRLEYMKKIVKKFKIRNINLYGEQFKKLSKLNSIPLNVTMNNNKLKKKINFRFTKYNKYLVLIKKKYAKKIKI